LILKEFSALLKTWAIQGEALWIKHLALPQAGFPQSYPQKQGTA
jgi:hypothetical protein